MTLLPVVLGLDYGGTKIAVAVCDLHGNQLAAQVVASGGELGAQAGTAAPLAAAEVFTRTGSDATDNPHETEDSEADGVRIILHQDAMA